MEPITKIVPKPVAVMKQMAIKMYGAHLAQMLAKIRQRRCVHQLVRRIRALAAIWMQQMAARLAVRVMVHHRACQAHGIRHNVASQVPVVKLRPLHLVCIKAITHSIHGKCI